MSDTIRRGPTIETGLRTIFDSKGVLPTVSLTQRKTVDRIVYNAIIDTRREQEVGVIWVLTDTFHNNVTVPYIRIQDGFKKAGYATAAIISVLGSTVEAGHDFISDPNGMNKETLALGAKLGQTGLLTVAAPDMNHQDYFHQVDITITPEQVVTFLARQQALHA